MPTVGLLNKHVQSLVFIVILAIFFIATLLLFMDQMAASKNSSTIAPQHIEQPLPQQNVLPDLEKQDEIVATVNDRVITRQAWQQATRLDAVMSQLSRQPIPTAEETLDRLVNETVVLEAETGLPAPNQDQIEAKIAGLASAWNVTDDEIVSALAEVGLSRTDLTTRVEHLLQVEAALNQLAAQENDLDAWLIQARTSAEIGLYRSLVDTAFVPTLAADVAKNEIPAEDELLSEIAEPAEQPQIFAPPADMPVSPYPQNAAPDFSLAQLNGEQLTLSDFRGKPTVINFWATWCPPCRRELPALQAAYNAHRDDIGFVAVDVKENVNTVQSFVDELGLTFPVVVDADGAVSDGSYQVRGLPTTFFVDANGVVIARHVGPLDETTIDTYLSPLLESAPAVAQTQPTVDNQVPALTMSGPDNSASIATGETDLPASTLLAADQPAAQMSEGEQANAGSMESSSQPAQQQAGSLTAAPNFILTAADSSSVSLQDYKDKSSVVLVFYRGHT